MNKTFITIGRLFMSLAFSDPIFRLYLHKLARNCQPKRMTVIEELFELEDIASTG
jgi:hypothetical protein